MPRQIERLLTATEVAHIFYGGLPGCGKSTGTDRRHCGHGGTFSYQLLQKAKKRGEVPAPIDLGAGEERRWRWLPDTLHLWHMSRRRRPLLLTPPKAAQYAGMSREQFKRLSNGRRTPRPLQLTPDNRNPRWRRRDIEEWLLTGECESWGPILWDSAESLRMLRLGPISHRGTGHYTQRSKALKKVIAGGLLGAPVLWWERGEPSEIIRVRKRKGKAALELFTSAYGPPIFIAREAAEPQLMAQTRVGRRMPSEWKETPLLDDTDLAHLLHVSISQLKTLRTTHGFPERIALTKEHNTRNWRWRRSDVVAWLLEKERAAAEVAATKSDKDLLSDEDLAAALQVPLPTLRRLGIPRRQGGFRADIVAQWLADLHDTQRRSEQDLAQIALVWQRDAEAYLSIHPSTLATYASLKRLGIVGFPLPIPKPEEERNPIEHVEQHDHEPSTSQGGKALRFRLRSLRQAVGLPSPQVPLRVVSQSDLCLALAITKSSLHKIAKTQRDAESIFMREKPTVPEPACRNKVASRRDHARRQREKLQAYRQENPGLPTPRIVAGLPFYPLRPVAAWLDALEAAEREPRKPAPAEKFPEAEAPSAAPATAGASTPPAIPGQPQGGERDCPCGKGKLRPSLTAYELAERLKVTVQALSNKKDVLIPAGARVGDLYARCSACNLLYLKRSFAIGVGRGGARR